MPRRPRQWLPSLNMVPLVVPALRTDLLYPLTPRRPWTACAVLAPAAPPAPAQAARRLRCGVCRGAGPRRVKSIEGAAVPGMLHCRLLRPEDTAVSCLLYLLKMHRGAHPPMRLGTAEHRKTERKKTQG
ncbi:hypothetical protein NDU88_007451 [Pleurodeles waltl]|uniref:Uncharacterized protein n=1 Tax=Pleurodeles waltl TaxID=8319 RepID=A0AAV7PU33_PLEWA|nr:hypothetical protein NDU88_007451 [Pleurodeles waltl]